MIVKYLSFWALLSKFSVVKYRELNKITGGVRDVNKINRKPRNEKMYRAILSLKTVEECEQFFDDLCTVTELQALEQRFQVAWLLNKGMIYNDILQETGASSLQYGRDGYAAVFERLEKEEKR